MYVDLQWICEVHCYSDGTYRILSGAPDPLFVRSGLRVMEVAFYPIFWHLLLCLTASILHHSQADVAQAIKISTHFLTTGRVCANCAVTRHRKMRRCPCGKAYYCGRECQKEHWRRHKENGCGL